MQPAFGRAAGSRIGARDGLNVLREPAAIWRSQDELVAHDAERQALAGVLDLLDREPATAREIVGGLAADMFRGEATAEVFTAASAALASTADVTVADVLAALRRAGYEQGSDAHTLLIDLVADRIGTGASAARLAKDAADEVRDFHARRQAMEAAAIVAASGGHPDDVAELIARLEGVRSAGQPAALPKSLRDALEEWAATDDVPRIETAFRPLDELTGGGLPRGSLTVIAGQPGAGKSAMALQLVAGALLVDRNLKAVWGLGEMSIEALARRAVAVGSVLLGSDRPVTLDAAGRRTGPAKAIADSLRDTIADRLVIAAPLTLDRVEAAVEATGAGLVVIDYLQLVQGDAASDRRQEVDAVVRRLRELTIDRGLALVAISNIAKTVGRDSRIGSLGKESAEIDFAADLFLLGEPDADEDENGLRAVRWRCMKNRHGRPHDIEATFDGSLQVFTAHEADPFPEFANFSQGGR